MASSEFSLNICSQHDRLPESYQESFEKMSVRTAPGIDGEKAKFTAWESMEKGCRCGNCQRLARIRSEEVKLAIDMTTYPPLPLAINRRSPNGLSNDAKEVMTAALRFLKQ